MYPRPHFFSCEFTVGAEQVSYQDYEDMLSWGIDMICVFAELLN